MKASELMIGDWVMSTLGSHQPVKVYAIGNNFIDLRYGEIAQSGILALCDFEPIPITEEILKANGIMYQFGRPWWQKADPFGNPNQYEVHINNVTTVIVDYVHELQHALRLCGLNELADNFKVE